MEILQTYVHPASHDLCFSFIVNNKLQFRSSSGGISDLDVPLIFVLLMNAVVRHIKLISEYVSANYQPLDENVTVVHLQYCLTIHASEFASR